MTDLANSITPAADFEAVRDRYRIERERREAAGDRRYSDSTGGRSQLLADPYSGPLQRDAVDEQADVLVVGGGFGGLLAAVRLHQAGVQRIRIVEAGGDVGGTWYWNRYPGAACDIESYIYFPLLEETGYMPVERYSKASEIRAHCRRIAEHFGLYDDVLLSTQVTKLDWDSQAARWRVGTDRGDVIRARFVVLSTGPLNRPKLPEIQGAESFKGHHFHTSRWDYAYTGGGPTELMTGLADKRVGIIGTGATAVQCVPPLAAAAKELYVFQRTPSSVDARNNTPTDPQWAASLKPGWQKARMASFTAQFTSELATVDEVGDGWTVLARAMREMISKDPSLLADPGALLERADLQKMEEIRARMDAIVEDPATAEALKPWFSLFCKRPCFHDHYLQAFNQSNVILVDTAGRGVEAMTERGVMAGGREYELDCLIFATGFETSTDFSKRSGFEVRGVDGLTLTRKWSKGLSTLHGMHTRGFPNCFIISQAQSGMSPNFPHMLDEQTVHISHIVEQSLKRNVRTVEASEQAEESWVGEIVRMGEGRRKMLEGCTPGYYNAEGRVSDGLVRALPYGDGPLAFMRLMQAWREQGELEGLELSYS